MQPTQKPLVVANVQVQNFKIKPIKNGIHLSFKLKNNRADYLGINKVAACVATLNTDQGYFQGYIKPKIVAPSEEFVAEVSFPHAKGKIQGLSLESIIIANKDGVQTEKSQPIKIKVPVNMVTG